MLTANSIKDVKRIDTRIVAYRVFSVFTSELREAKSFLENITKFHVEISHSKLCGKMKTKQLIIIIKEAAEKVSTKTDEKQYCGQIKIGEAGELNFEKLKEAIRHETWHKS